MSTISSLREPLLDSKSLESIMIVPTSTIQPSNTKLKVLEKQIYQIFKEIKIINSENTLAFDQIKRSSIKKSCICSLTGIISAALMIYVFVTSPEDSTTISMLLLSCLLCSICLANVYIKRFKTMSRNQILDNDTHSEIFQQNCENKKTTIEKIIAEWKSIVEEYQLKSLRPIFQNNQLDLCQDYLLLIRHYVGRVNDIIYHYVDPTIFVEKMTALYKEFDLHISRLAFVSAVRNFSIQTGQSDTRLGEDFFNTYLIHWIQYFNDPRNHVPQRWVYN